MTANIFSKLKFKRLANKRGKSNSGTSYDVAQGDCEDESDKQVTLKRYLKLPSNDDYLALETPGNNGNLQKNGTTDCQSSDEDDAQRFDCDTTFASGSRNGDSRQERWSDPPLGIVNSDERIQPIAHSVSLQAPLARPESDTIVVDEDEAMGNVASSSMPIESVNGNIEVEPGYQTIDEVKKQIAKLRRHNGTLVKENSIPSCSSGHTSLTDERSSSSSQHKETHMNGLRDPLCYADSGVDSPGILSSSPMSQSRYNSNNSSVLSETDFHLMNSTSGGINNVNTLVTSSKQLITHHRDQTNHDKVSSDSEDGETLGDGIVSHRQSSTESKESVEELYAVPNKRKSCDMSNIDEVDKLSMAVGPVPSSLDLVDSLSPDGADDEPPPLPARAYGSLPSSPTTPHSAGLTEHSSNPELWNPAEAASFCYENQVMPPGLSGGLLDADIVHPATNSQDDRENWVYQDMSSARKKQANSLDEGSVTKDKWPHDSASVDSRSSLSRSVPDIQRRRLPSPPRSHRRTNSSGQSAASSDEPKTVDFFESIQMLKMCGWYWGPLSWDDAESKLANKPDGSFLVRDSSDERYILSLSFKSQGKTHHTRIEHHKGLFSFHSQPRSHGHGTIVDFIERAMAHSKNGKFLYFLRPRGQGFPPIPLQLLYPISRFQTMMSLQHMCRFVILKFVRKDHIGQLPLPSRTKDYLMESQYYAENIEDDDGASTDSTLTES